MPLKDYKGPLLDGATVSPPPPPLPASPPSPVVPHISDQASSDLTEDLAKALRTVLDAIDQEGETGHYDTVIRGCITRARHALLRYFETIDSAAPITVSFTLTEVAVVVEALEKLRHSHASTATRELITGLLKRLER